MSFAIELRGLSKAFGSIVANAQIDLKVEAGTIHGVIGENGAGKSTAMKMLYGLISPDAGDIWIDGQRRVWRSPVDAIGQGLGMVHQHFMLAGPYTVLDNIILGVETSPASRGQGRLATALRMFKAIDRNAARTRLQAICQQYALEVDLDARVETLPVGMQQRVEILKLLYRHARILILDEPTAVLTPPETASLFANLKRLRAEGKTVIIITHKLNEVLSLTDGVTVFRAGRVVAQCATKETNMQELADLMVGRRVHLNAPVAPPRAKGASALEVEGLVMKSKTGQDLLRGVSLGVDAGEIVGIAGVEGNGQAELVPALLGLTGRLTAGRVKVLGQDVANLSTSQIRALGVGVIPADRHQAGLLLGASLIENFALGLHRQSPYGKYGLIDWERLGKATRAAMDEFDIRPREAGVPAAALSGGNQQKLIIARELAVKPKLLIASQPTRGVDVGAMEFIHKRLVMARDDGVGILLVSSDLDEILSLSDRILVMYRGAIVASFRRGECSERELGAWMGGGPGEGKRACAKEAT